MEKTLKLLVIGNDPTLQGELDKALENVRRRTVAHYAKDHRHGVELARSHQPDIVFAPLTRDLRAIKALAEEISLAAPEAWLAALYKRDVFGPDHSEGAIIIEALRARVSDFLRRPVSSTELRALFERLDRKPARQRVEPGTVVSFVSNKGGVGKSTLAVNTAVGLAQKFPDRVLLVDASLQVGHCSSMLNLTPEGTIADAVREWDRLDETFLRQLSTQHSSGLRLLPAPHKPIEASDVHAEAMARILSLARRAFDYVVVDTFPMLDAVVIAILDASDRVYVVLHGLVPTVVGVARYLETLERVNVPKERVSVVLNEVHPRFMGALHRSDVAEKLGRDLDHTIPFDKRLLISANMGEPYVLHARGGLLGLFGSGYRKAMDGIIESVEATRTARASAPAIVDSGSAQVSHPTNGSDARPIIIVEDELESGRVGGQEPEPVAEAEGEPDKEAAL